MSKLPKTDLDCYWSATGRAESMRVNPFTRPLNHTPGLDHCPGILLSCLRARTCAACMMLTPAVVGDVVSHWEEVPNVCSLLFSLTNLPYPEVRIEEWGLVTFNFKSCISQLSLDQISRNFSLGASNPGWHLASVAFRSLFFSGWSQSESTM